MAIQLTTVLNVIPRSHFSISLSLDTSLKSPRVAHSSKHPASSCQSNSKGYTKCSLPNTAGRTLELDGEPYVCLL
jgi:hypothetical protein